MFSFVVTYDPVEDRGIKDVMDIFFVFLSHIFHVTMSLFSNRPQKTSKCGKNKSDTRYLKKKGPVHYLFAFTTF